MRRKIAYLIIVICVIGIIYILTKNLLHKEQKIDYSNLQFDNVKISDSKINRYNELINTPQISYLIRNLYAALKEDEMDLLMGLKFSSMYAYTFLDDYEENIIEKDDKVYVKEEYMEKVIYDIFGKEIELGYYVEDNNYILVNFIGNVTDTIELKVNQILYNAKYDIYKIIIQEEEQKIKIIYSNDNGKYTLLWCSVE